MVVNRVQQENEIAAMREPGQTLTGNALESDRLMMLEIYFDDAHWGDPFFALGDVVTAVHDRR